MKILLHGHHLGLLSAVKSKASRIADIRTTKSPAKHDLRLRLLQSVPLSLLPKPVVKAAKLLYKADKALYKADKTWDKLLYKADKALYKANKAWDKAWDKLLYKARDKARALARDNFEVVCNEHKPALEALHKKLCVADCPWDGERILPD